MMINPAGQAIFHEVAVVRLFEPRAWLAFLVVGLMLALSWKLRRADWVASFGMLWFLLLLVPSSALIALNQGEPMAEHRVYLASCGIFLTAGAAVGWLGAWIARFSGPAEAGPHVRFGYVRFGRVRLGGAVAFAVVLMSFGVE